MAALDNVRDRWERMAPRERTMMVMLAVTFVVCIFAFVGFNISDGLTSIEDKNDEAREALAAMQHHRINEGSTATPGSEGMIPDEPVKLSRYLEDIVQDVGITSPTYPTPKETAKGKYVEISFKLSLKDLTIYELKDFLEKVESKSPVVVIRELHVKRNFRDKEKLNAEMTIATFKKAAAGEGEDKDKDEG
jgi:hypothetical protein